MDTSKRGEFCGEPTQQETNFHVMEALTEGSEREVFVVDEDAPYLRGVVMRGEIMGRWGFGSKCSTTSAFYFSRPEDSSSDEEQHEGDGGVYEEKLPRHDNLFVDGDYTGHFEILQYTPPPRNLLAKSGQEGSVLGTWSTKRVLEKARFVFVAKDDTVEIKATGENEYGRFEMTGRCSKEGESLEMVRKYEKAASTPSRRRRDDADANKTFVVTAAPTTRASRSSVSAGEDAASPVADIFDAARKSVLSRQIEVGSTATKGVRRALTVDIEEAAELVRSLVAPKPFSIETTGGQAVPKPRGASFGDDLPACKSCSSTERATTLVSEIDYERYVRTFVDAFEKGGFRELSRSADEVLAEASAALPDVPEPQIVRLVVEHETDVATRAKRRRGEGNTEDDEDEWSILKEKSRSAPAVLKPSEHSRLAGDGLTTGPAGTVVLRGDVEPTNPGPFHVNVLSSHGFGIKGFDGLDELVEGGARLARQGARSVVLDARISAGSSVEKYCDDLADVAGMQYICPAHKGWRFGPTGATLAGGEDRRHYLIVGWEGGLTPTHCDFGVQAVLYNTLAGCNRVVGVPREVAVVLHALRESLVGKGLGLSKECDKYLIEFETKALKNLLEDGKLEYDEFKAGESMLIMPRGGHAVLTGKGDKVVLAGEWHLEADGKAALALPNAYNQKGTSQKIRAKGRRIRPSTDVDEEGGPSHEARVADDDLVSNAANATSANVTVSSSDLNGDDEDDEDVRERTMPPMITKGLGRREPGAPTCRDRALSSLSSHRGEGSDDTNNISSDVVQVVVSEEEEVENTVVVDDDDDNAETTHETPEEKTLCRTKSNHVLVISNVKEALASRVDLSSASRIELESEQSSALLMLKQVLAEAKVDCDINVHLRPTWDVARWQDPSLWSRVALETDVAAARAVGATSVVVGSLVKRRKRVEGVVGEREQVALNDELLVRLVEAARPHTKVAFAATSFDAVVGQAHATTTKIDRAVATLDRLAALGLSAAYTGGRLFDDEEEYARLIDRKNPKIDLLTTVAK